MALISDCARGIDLSSSSCVCPEGKLDQKNPLQSTSSKMYGSTRVSNLTQFKTKKIK